MTDQLRFTFDAPDSARRPPVKRRRGPDEEVVVQTLPLPDAPPAQDAALEEPPPQLFVFVPDIDVHLHDPDRAVANVAGPEPERALHWLRKVVSDLEIIGSRRALFPTKDLDRFLCIMPPHKVTLDAACLAVARAMWAQAFGWKPIRVDRSGRRLIGASVRWPQGWRVQDAPWTAIATLDRLGVPFDVEPRARLLLTRKLADSGTHIAQAGVRGSAVTLVTSRPDLLEALELPALAYDGPAGTGRYRLPVLAAGQLLQEPAVNCTPELVQAIRHATRRTRPIIPDASFPWTLYPFQAKDLGKALHIVEHTGGVLLAGDMGSGKALDARTPVCTPAGMRPIGSLHVGDEVLGRDGRAHRIRGVFPQGVRPMFRVHFSDGTSVRVDDEHLWQVQPVSGQHLDGYGEVVSTRRLRSRPLSDADGTPTHRVPMLTAPLEMDCGLVRTVSPYTLGSSLAGRCTVCSLLACGSRSSAGWAVSGGRHVPVQPGVTVAVVDAAPCGCGTRRVPDAYKYGPVATRVALLQGLLDRGGHVDVDGKSGPVTFACTSVSLARDVQWLVESLGGTAQLVQPPGPVAGDQFDLLDAASRAEPWQVRICLPGTFVPFRLPHKVSRYRQARICPPVRDVVAITPDGAAEAVCIEVESPDALFVVEHAVVTHNTTVSLALVEHLQTWPLLVVAPLAAFSTWQRQLGEMGKESFLCVEQIPVARQRLKTERFDAVVISYDRIHQFMEEIEHANFAAVVADEIQRIRTPGSRRSRALRALAATMPIRVGLSGTPITNRAEDILPLGAFLVPGEWKPRLSLKDLSEVYPGDDPVDQLAEHLGTMMVRRRMEDTGAKLPGRTVKRVEVPLSADQRRALHEMEEEAKAAKEAGELNHIHIFARLQRMRQIINIPSAAGIAGPNAKVAAAVDLAVEYAEVGRKSVIFVADRPAWVEVGKRCEAAGLGWTGIWGSTSVVDRIANEKKFHTNPDIQVFVGTLAACAESLTLSPTATVTIFASLSYSPSAIAQAAARTYRMNQTNDVDEIYLHASAPGGTLDDRMHEILELKRELFAKVVDRTEYRRMNEKVGLGDLMYMLTGVRDKTLDDNQLHLELEAAEKERRRKHARATLYRHKTGEMLDDGSTAMTREEWLAQEAARLEADTDDSGDWEELLDGGTDAAGFDADDVDDPDTETLTAAGDLT